MHEWRDFYLTVDGQAGTYTVEARGLGGNGPGPEALVLPAPDAVFWSYVAQIQGGSAPPLDALRQVGQALFQALFPYRTLGTFMAARGASPSEARQRLNLNVRPPELHALPWELLHDPFQASFVVADRRQTLVRTLDSPLAVRPPKLHGPLRLLYVSANPRHTEPLELIASQAALLQATAAWAEVVHLPHATPETLRETLRQTPFHLLHYDGHATLDERDSTGYLLLEDAVGDLAPLSGEMLANYLAGTDVQLVVLAGCYTAGSGGALERLRLGMEESLELSSRPKTLLLERSIVAELARRGVPAVLGIHYSMPDTVMKDLIHTFYTVLGGGASVEEALVEARLALRSVDNEGAWLAPLLYLRASQGRLWQQAVQAEAARGATTIYRATLRGDGAIAQGRGATAIGKGGTLIKGDVKGDIFLGSQGGQESQESNAGDNAENDK